MKFAFAEIFRTVDSSRIATLAMPVAARQHEARVHQIVAYRWLRGLLRGLCGPVLTVKGLERACFAAALATCSCVTFLNLRGFVSVSTKLSFGRSDKMRSVACMLPSRSVSRWLCMFSDSNVPSTPVRRWAKHGAYCSVVSTGESPPSSSASVLQISPSRKARQQRYSVHRALCRANVG